MVSFPFFAQISSGFEVPRSTLLLPVLPMMLHTGCQSAWLHFPELRRAWARGTSASGSTW
jgi:hypothetical protein